MQRNPDDEPFRRRNVWRPNLSLYNRILVFILVGSAVVLVVSLGSHVWKAAQMTSLPIELQVSFLSFLTLVSIVILIGVLRRFL